MTDQVIEHLIKGELDITLPEALTEYTLRSLMMSLPLPQFHKLTELRYEEETRYEREAAITTRTGKWILHVEWEGPKEPALQTRVVGIP